MTRKLRVGLVGTGFGTRVHLPGYARCADDVEVVAVCSAQRERAEAVAQTWGIGWSTDDYRALVERPEVDMVDVCTPPLTHREIVLAAVAAGKHVLCEKPMAATAGQAEEMLAAADRAGIVHAVNHEMRYEPVRRYLRRLVAEDFLGRVQLVVAAVHAGQGTDPAQEPYYWGWAVLADHCGGFVMSSLSHHLDLAQFTFGEITELSARATTLITERPVLTFEYRDGDPIGPGTPTAGTRPVDADDTVVLTGVIGDGALLSVSGSWSLRFPAGIRLDAYGDAGSLHLEPDGRLFGARAGEPALRELPVPTDLALEPAAGEHRFIPAFAALAREFAVTARGAPPADPALATFADGARLQRVLDISRQAAVAPAAPEPAR
jgi:predicted dehydrogenase